jgi:hypothetical protein
MHIRRRCQGGNPQVAFPYRLVKLVDGIRQALDIRLRALDIAVAAVVRERHRVVHSFLT